MKILVQDTSIETTEIADIRDIEADKTHFINREAGFVIIMQDGKKHVFGQGIPYESYPSEIAAIKNKWNKLMQDVIRQWEKDKSSIPVFKLNT